MSSDSWDSGLPIRSPPIAVPTSGASHRNLESVHTKVSPAVWARRGIAVQTSDSGPAGAEERLHSKNPSRPAPISIFTGKTRIVQRSLTLFDIGVGNGLA